MCENVKQYTNTSDYFTLNPNSSLIRKTETELTKYLIGFCIQQIWIQKPDRIYPKPDALPESIWTYIYRNLNLHISSSIHCITKVVQAVSIPNIYDFKANPKDIIQNNQTRHQKKLTSYYKERCTHEMYSQLLHPKLFTSKIPKRKRNT